MTARPVQAAGAGVTLAAALLIALLLRCIWAASLGGPPAFDARTYFELAQRIAATFAYAHQGEPTAFWPVGYPAMLAAVFRLFGAELPTAWALNVVANVASLACLYAIALQLGLDRRVAAASALLGAFNPVYLSYSCVVVTESVFNALVLLATALAMRPRAGRGRLIAGGALLGVAALVRPIALALPLVLGLACLPLSTQLRRGLQRVLWLSVGLWLVIGPWCARNAVALGVFAPVSTNGGMNLYVGNNPQAIGRFDDALMVGPLAPYAQNRHLGGQREVEFDRLTRGLALRYMREQPGEVLARLPSKLLFTYLPDLTALTWNRAPDSAGARALLPRLPLLIALHELALLVLAAIGLLRARAMRAAGRQPAPLLSLPLAMIAFFTLACLMYFGMPRYHFPMFPWLELYAAIALVGRRHSASAPPQ